MLAGNIKTEGVLSIKIATFPSTISAATTSGLSVCLALGKGFNLFLGVKISIKLSSPNVRDLISVYLLIL
ncbi:hypothetical protein HMPREF0216_03241 [Clostridium celatum DSM 1785]|uniref:Uncharacterized protein n=1 Tax=Clostridium celatum DSM 1785 TaxID=545697 RepID=L1Q3G4_9CLOT|nr:hypothetical protein HMPREF0216_03241 [Clostridium celatum DSM 1785]